MLYINGEWKEAQTKEVFPVFNPATGELIKSVAKASEEDTNDAICSADLAFKTWKSLTAVERSKYIKSAADLFRSKANEIGKIITLEMGKPLEEAITETNLAIDYLDWFAEEGKRIYGDTIPASSSDKRIIVQSHPVGVVGAITPWNFPILTIMRKIAPALAAGCTVVLKAASSTPLTSIEIGKVFHESGLPKGVINIVNGNSTNIVGAMMKSPLVRKITFTGSTSVGKELVRQSADTMKRVSMELGGHAPFIVFEDSDIETAVDSVIISKFRNAGQTCVCANRVYVQDSIAQEFAELLSKKVKNIKVGNGLESGVTMGPLINEGAIQTAQSHVEDAIKNGAQLLCGGKRISTGIFAEGYFYEPTVLLGATEEMIIAKEETFGPVAPIFTFSTEDEVVEKANNSIFGLASYLFTRDSSRVFRMAENLEYGMIGINDPLLTVPQAPFGGIKESGMGREGGKYGIQEFLEYKYLSLKI